MPINGIPAEFGSEVGRDVVASLAYCCEKPSPNPTREPPEGRMLTTALAQLPVTTSSSQHIARLEG